jgi:hypothetical protein
MQVTDIPNGADNVFVFELFDLLLSRYSPSEDCGGIHGYENVYAVLVDPKHEEHEETRVWVGEGWDPEKFNPDEVKFDNPYKRWVHAFLEK